jgi:hypothetical protein
MTTVTGLLALFSAVAMVRLTLRREKVYGSCAGPDGLRDRQIQGHCRAIEGAVVGRV